MKSSIYQMSDVLHFMCAITKQPTTLLKLPSAWNVVKKRRKKKKITIYNCRQYIFENFSRRRRQWLHVCMFLVLIWVQTPHFFVWFLTNNFRKLFSWSVYIHVMRYILHIWDRCYCYCCLNDWDETTQMAVKIDDEVCFVHPVNQLTKIFASIFIYVNIFRDTHDIFSCIFWWWKISQTFPWHKTVYGSFIVCDCVYVRS